MKKVMLFLALALTAVAADKPPRLLRLYQVQVPAETSSEFFAVQRDIAGIYKANNAPMARSAWTSMTGPAMFYYVLPLSDLAKLGERTWLQQQGDEGSRQARASRLSKASGASATKIVTYQEDVTWTAAGQAAPAAFDVVTVYSVKPGKVTDFLAVAKEASDTLKKIGKAKGVFVGRVTFGGDGYEFHVVVGYDSMADLAAAGGAIRTAMGDTTYDAYIQKMAATVNSMHRDIIRYRPEYSYAPAK